MWIYHEGTIHLTFYSHHRDSLVLLQEVGVSRENISGEQMRSAEIQVHNSDKQTKDHSIFSVEENLSFLIINHIMKVILMTLD